MWISGFINGPNAETSLVYLINPLSELLVGLIFLGDLLFLLQSVPIAVVTPAGLLHGPSYLRAPWRVPSLSLPRSYR